MTNEAMAARVRRLADAAGLVGLILPRGWFGRPYDNLLSISSVESGPDALTITSEGRLVLRFQGTPQVSRGADGLMIVGFKWLDWNWVEFGSTTAHHESFLDGVVTMVPPQDFDWAVVHGLDGWNQ